MDHGFRVAGAEVKIRNEERAKRADSGCQQNGNVQLKPAAWELGVSVMALLRGDGVMSAWTIAEQAGDATPDGMQHLLAGARWDADAVRDDVRACVIGHLGHAGAVLVVDETGDVAAPPVSRCTGWKLCTLAEPVLDQFAGEGSQPFRVRCGDDDFAAACDGGRRSADP